MSGRYAKARFENVEKAIRIYFRGFYFCYDYNRYGLTYDNNLYIADIFESLENYAQSYWIYAAPDAADRGELRDPHGYSKNRQRKFSAL